MTFEDEGPQLALVDIMDEEEDRSRRAKPARDLVSDFDRDISSGESKRSSKRRR